MDTTVITSAWLDPIRWADGWNILLGTHGTEYPSIWVIDTAAAHVTFDGRYENILSMEENARSNRFHQPAHAIRYRTARTVLRLLLSRATATDPAAIRFTTGHHRKPLLTGSPGNPIEFNLSYSENNAIIGMANGHPVGIDIEWLHRPLAFDDMLSACFSEREIAFITSRNEDMQRRFFTLWTRKEAVLKLTGEGIGEHLPYFEVLDGTCVADKKVIGGQPPSAIYLYSFPIGRAFLGCFAAPMPVSEVYFNAL